MYISVYSSPSLLANEEGLGIRLPNHLMIREPVKKRTDGLNWSQKSDSDHTMP